MRALTCAYLLVKRMKECLLTMPLFTVNPVPPYLIVEGCSHSENCVLEVSHKDNLTCSLPGIRPKVKLELHVLSASQSATISFLKNDMTTSSNDFTFDVSLVSHFHISGVLGSVVELQCKVTESDASLFNISRNIVVRFIKDSSVPANTTPDTIKTTKKRYLWFLWFLWFLALPVMVIIVLVYKWKSAKETHSKDSQSKIKASPDEIQQMVPVLETTPKDINDEKQMFISQLKKKYEVLYESIQPIPYIKDRLYCVEKIFVEGGLQIFDESLKQWKQINSHEELFGHISKNTTICIIEGEPGYGKSTLTLRLAYDWCNPEKSTCLSNVDLFILLQLRQLAGVESIYRAIRRFLLPSDSSLREEDIKDILDTCKNVVVLFDGYDEYNFESDNVDIMRIIKYEMFQDFQILVTTRSSFLLPKRLPRTEKMRLSGFDRKARRSYIQRAVVGGDNKSLAAKVEKHLENNPILNDLCQVPLLFVVFAHMTHEREDFTTLNSVTRFFRYMVSTFHSHMRAKLSEKEAKQYQLLESKHQKLNKVAFEALRRKTKNIVWRKEELLNTLGQENYNMLYHTGILVEEEILDISDNSHISISEHIQYRTQVRFYHKLFCEWYAAHYICDYVKESPSTSIGQFLRTFDPYDLQYVYRFACGLNKKVAKLIIEYLMTRYDSNKFAILCILEHTGSFDDIQEVIHRLCNEGVIISETDTQLLQRSTIQLLEIASRIEVVVKYVKFHNSISSVDNSSRNIILRSGLSFSKNIRVEAIAIDLDNRDMTAKELEDLLLFSSSCRGLGLLSLDCCLPPRFLDFSTFESNLIERSFTVEWQLTDSCPTFVLDLQTGRWQNSKTKEELTQEYYKILRVTFSGIDQKRKRTPESDKLKVKEMRATLRKLSDA
ncbi:NLR family CARD domain-containing protein 4 [Holothuria leucospilota]|uniref:NLR family CARD domain-containing protein 4 n=1 Tax=Holothuria leucospilota TaxID=206669 RepID=A0A9Q1BSK1_HOLLE|nr:NLR family CARD domain-containing protein 4 [Holothuria leucospilota]